MPYKVPTLQQLMENLEKSYAAENAKIKDSDKKIPLSVQIANSRVLSYAFNALFNYLTYMGDQSIPTRSEKEYLRSHCAAIGLYPKHKSKAYGTIIIDGEVSAHLAGGEMLRREDGFLYTVSESITLSANEQIVKVIADQAGVAGNCAAGTVLTFVKAQDRINSSARVELIGAGADDETDEELLSRYVEYMRNLYMGGADSDYIKWALEVEGVSRAWVYPHAMGAGTVTIRIMTSNGFPDAILLQKVKDYIDSKRPVTVKRIFVLAPTAKPINIEIANLNPDTAEMREAVTASLRQSFARNAEPGGLVLVSRIHSAVLSTLNLVDYRLISPVENIQCGAGEIAQLGEITWS